MFCTKCGKENEGNNTFCKFCGAPIGGAAPVVPPQAAPGKPGKSKALILGVGAGVLAVIVAVVLILVLVVFKSNSSASGPEQTVTEFMQAAAKGDVNKMLSFMDSETQDLMQTYAEMSGVDLETMLSEAFTSEMPAGATNMQVKDMKFNTTVSGDTAEVEIVAGTMSYRDANGKLVEKKLDAADAITVPLLKQNGKWYIDFVQMGL